MGCLDNINMDSYFRGNDSMHMAPFNVIARN